MNNYCKNLSLKMKIMGTAAMLLILLAVTTFFALYALTQIGKELSSIANQDIPLTEKITIITEHQLEQSLQLERALRFSNINSDTSSAGARYRAAVDAFKSLDAMVDEEIRDGEAFAEEAMSNAHDVTAKKEFEHVDQQLKKIEASHHEFSQHAQEIFSLIDNGNLAEAERLAHQIEQEEAALNSELEALLHEIEKFTEQAAHLAEEHEQQAAKTLAIISLLALIFGSIVSWHISSRIVKSVRQVIITASGDLTQEITVDSRDEVGELLEAMQGMRNKLKGMVTDISDTTNQLSSSAVELSAVTTQTSACINEQCAETEQVATAMQEMTATVQEVSRNITETAQATREANSETADGRRLVEDSIRAIQSLAGQIETSSQVIHKVEQESDNINTILDVIKGVAEQTNLLALNAAIEAARAGEQGRGFAVVADEVRTLAGRTQQSTDEINQMIDRLQSGSRQAVQVMQKSREQAQSVVEQATQAGNSLTTIAASVSSINDMNTQIASAAEQQHAVAEEVNRNILKINDICNQTATGATQTAQASQELAEMGTRLQSLVNTFKVT